MNKYEKAIATIKILSLKSNINTIELQNDLDLVIESLEKQIPKKVKYINGGLTICPDEDCGNTVLKYYTYCPDCAQKLEWMNENRNQVIIIDAEKEYKELAEIFEHKLITINTNDFTTINPFEIDEKCSRQEALSRIKALTVIANKDEEIVNIELIKELANKNNFKITDDEICNILDN